MDNGYVISAISDVEKRQATALAYSLKSTMPNTNVTLVTDSLQQIDRNYFEPFDEIAEFPFKIKGTTRQNDWQLYWASPYTNTIALDCKSLLKEDQSQLWEYLIDGYDIAFPDQVLHYNGNKIFLNNRKVYKEEYFANNLCTSMFYWKKDTELSLKYFKMADVIMQWWEDSLRKFYAEHHVPVHYDSDITHSLIASLIGEDLTVNDKELFTYIDMQNTLANGYLGRWDKWTDRLSVWASNNGKIKIQNFAINRLLSYNDDNFLTQEIYDEQRNYFRYANKK